MKWFYRWLVRPKNSFLRRKALKWYSARQLRQLPPYSGVAYAFDIPDPTRPIPEDERGVLGPGAWLMPLHPQLPAPPEVEGRAIEEVSATIETYGMGGAGFFGLRLDREWLVVAVHGAGEWIEIDGRMVNDFFHDEHNRAPPWLDDDSDDLSEKIVGAVISRLQVDRRALEIRLDNGMAIRLTKDFNLRPFFQGTGRPRDLLPDDDLRRAVFLSSTREIWV